MHIILTCIIVLLAPEIGQNHEYDSGLIRILIMSTTLNTPIDIIKRKLKIVDQTVVYALIYNHLARQFAASLPFKIVTENLNSKLVFNLRCKLAVNL